MSIIKRFMLFVRVADKTSRDWLLVWECLSECSFRASRACVCVCVYGTCDSTAVI